jgi:high-affinity iron transporter
MFATAIIVFREVLEAALIIGILAAATRGLPHRNSWLVGGVVIGLLGAGLVAFFIDVIGDWASGVGQELFNATVLGIAVFMLAWHNIWMASHGAALAKNAKSIGKSIQNGASECSILLVIVGLAVLREGSETVLFLYGIAASNTNGQSAMMLGGLIGVLGGVTLGFILYKGLLRIPLRWFFTATGILVLLLAAGMASQSAHFLIQADMITSLTEPLWDSSAILSESSVIGMLLHGLIGYDSRPAGMQVVFYLVAFFSIAAGMKWVGNPPRKLHP